MEISMHEKASKWIDLFERIVNIIKPQASNTIAKLVVVAGLLQITEYYSKILHAVVIALFEETIGKSEVLRAFLSVTSDPTVGIVLVISGLMYHLFITLGKDYIDTRKAALPKYPLLKCHLLNGDKEQQSAEFTIRGYRVNLPGNDDIPDHKDSEPNNDNPIFKEIQRITATYSPILCKPKNKDLFRERAKVLFDWAGAELLYVSIINDSGVLASGLSIKLSIPRDKGLYLSTPGHLPDVPQEEIEPFPHISALERLKVRDPKGISISSDARYYYVTWNVFRMQAQTEETSTDSILLKTDKSVEIECTIFCDELPEPITKTYIVHPAPETLDINVGQLVDNNSYKEISDKLIMDGYEMRIFRSMYEQYEMDVNRH